MNVARDTIRSGRFMPGTRLPSRRTLAADLSVARTLSHGAYSELVAEGRLTSKHGFGTAVSAATEVTAVTYIHHAACHPEGRA